MKIKYIRGYGLFIPKLTNRPMGVTLPLMDYVNNVPLSQDQQILEVTDKEGRDLIRQGHFEEYVEVVEKPKKQQVPKDASEEVENNG